VGTTLPITPVQILWINMTTAVALGLMLAFEPGEPDLMVRRPRDPGQPILTGILIGRIVSVSAILLMGAFGLFQLALEAGQSLEAARTVAVNSFVMVEVAYLFNCRTLTRPAHSVGWFTNRRLLLGVAVMLLLQLAFTYVPVMNTLFDSAPISASDWGLIILLALVAFVVVELEKAGRARAAPHARPGASPDVGQN
jgi:magnesium-transporting ATPase (P-type)